MKKVWIGLLVLIAASSGYSVLPVEPEPREGQLAVQLMKVDYPVKLDMTSGFALDSSQTFFADSNTLTQYPTLYAVVGTAVTNDQTKSVVFAEDFNIVDGKAVPKEKNVKLGLMIATKISKLENGVADLKLNFSIKKLNGFDEYTVADGVKVKMPTFESRSINTDVSIQLGSWIALGGLAEEADGQDTKTTIYLIRVTDAEVKNPTAVQITAEEIKYIQ